MTATTALQPHILHVTGYVDENEGLDEREFVIECPGVEVGRCAAYTPCEVEDCPSSADLRWPDGVAHGVEHSSVDGEWMVPTGECYYLTFGGDSLPDAACDIRSDGIGRCLTAGRYTVVPDYRGDGDYILDLLDTLPVVRS